MVLKNVSVGGKHWITLLLRGKRSNRLAIGAKVKVTAGEVVQIGEVRSGGSYLSQNDLRVHFGLGDSTKAEKIEIRWPSGETSRFGDLKADHFYRIGEGDDTAVLER
jgi:hypothetical protein